MEPPPRGGFRTPERTRPFSSICIATGPISVDGSAPEALPVEWECWGVGPVIKGRQLQTFPGGGCAERNCKLYFRYGEDARDASLQVAAGDLPLLQLISP
ncbi:UNVERIFIED_CONTAM: hypothetical protein K2H54_013349 [Gekko kuhli]